VSFKNSALEARAPGARINHRATVRYQCAPATTGRVILAADHEFQRAWVLDLSCRGVGLAMSRPVEAGTPLVVQLKSPNNQRVYELSAHVVHATPLPSGDFRVGCQFINAISAEDLDALL
jgi:hypothetical protein